MDVLPNERMFSQEEQHAIHRSQQGKSSSGSPLEDDEDHGGVLGRKRRRSRVEQHSASTAQMSGGEKSLTSTSLLMAIAKNVELPWRVLDEFDVFMDETTRQVALKRLVGAARSVGGAPNMSGHQFILITPHPTSNDVQRACPPGFLTMVPLQPPKREATLKDHFPAVGGAEGGVGLGS